MKQLPMFNHNHYALAFFITFCTSPLSGIFYSAAQYKHPETQSSVWLFSDIHIDVDPAFNLTRLHQKQLLEQAKKHDALLIVENCDYIANRIERSFNVVEYCAFYGAWASWVLYMSDEYGLYDLQAHSMKRNIRLLAALAAPIALVHWYKLFCDYRESNTVIDFDTHKQQLKNQYGSTFLPDYQHSPLIDMAAQARKHDISTLDVEFRVYSKPQALRDSGILQFEHKLARFITRNQLKYPITLEDYCQINSSIVEEIFGYDSPALQAWYQQCINNYLNSYITQGMFALAQEHKACELTHLTPLLSKKLSISQIDADIDWLTHDCSLLDARFMRAIELNRDNFNTIFVCAGGAHIDAIVPALEFLGYAKQRALGEENSQQCIDHNIFSRYETKVHCKHLDYVVIDLEKFFKQADEKDALSCGASSS